MFEQMNNKAEQSGGQQKERHKHKYRQPAGVDGKKVDVEDNSASSEYNKTSSETATGNDSNN